MLTIPETQTLSSLVNVNVWMIFYCSIQISYPAPLYPTRQGKKKKKKEANAIGASCGHIKKNNKLIFMKTEKFIIKASQSTYLR